MARIRTVKPEIWMSPQIMNVEHSSRLLFIGLITQADDEGRGTADPRRLKASIFGGDDITSSNVRRWLDDLAEQNLIFLYDTASHGLLYELPSWRTHQKIDRPKKSTYPSPTDGPIPPPKGGPFVDQSSNESRRVVGDRIGSEGSLGSDRTGSDGAAIVEPTTSTASPEQRGPADAWRDVTGVDPDAMQAWIQHREVNKPPGLAPHERIAVARILAGMGPPQVQQTAVQFAVGNGWRNLRIADGSKAKGTGSDAPGWRPDPAEEEQFQARMRAANPNWKP